MTEKARKPQIRFKGYTDAWELRKLGELCSVSMNKRIFKEQTAAAGDIPFYKIGTFGGEADAFISRSLFEDYKAKYPYPTVGDILISASGSIGRTVKYTGKDEYFQDSNIVWLTHDQRLHNSFLHCFYSVVKWEGIEGSTIKRLYNENILNTKISLPSSTEQRKVGCFFESLDNLITLHQRKYDKFVSIKKALLEKMFPQGSQTTPQIRFKGFTDAWELRKLGEMAPLRGGFAFKSEEYVNVGVPIIRISNILSDGTIGGEFEHFTEQDRDEVFALPNGAALLAMSGATTGKVSILQCKNTDIYYQNQRVGYFIPTSNCDYGFTSIVVRSPLFSEQLNSVLVAGAQPNVSAKDIDSFQFMLPVSLSEQKKIGEIFLSLDNLITLHQRQVEKLKNIKSALLEKMFV